MATTRTSSAGKVSFGSWESEEREHPQGCSFFCALSSAAALLGLRAHRARGFCSPKGLLFYFSRTVRECALRGIFSFSKENIPLTPPRERDEGPSPSTPHIASLQLEELQRLPNRVLCTWLRHESLRFVTNRNRALLREARVTIARRQTACGRHCCARRGKMKRYRLTHR